MIILWIVSGVIAGAIIAWVLNKLFPIKLENKGRRIGLQVASCIVFILLGFSFTSLFSLRIVLDRFIINRIQTMEASLSKMFPNTNIMETSFNTSELVSFNNQIQQSVNDINTKNDGFFERLVYDVFLGKLSSYINAADLGITTLATMSSDDGTVTIKTVMYNLKDMTLDAISPYFIVGRLLILILLFISIGIYIGITIYIKKGGTLYNKSIVYGDVNNKLQ